MVVQPDGKIVLVGSSSNAADNDFSVLRVLEDGRPDPSFNGTGQATTAVGRADDEALAVTLLDDGRIVAAGYTMNGDNRDFALACYHRDGSLDTTFGTFGMVVTAMGNGHDDLTGLATDQEGRIVVAGVTQGTSGGAVVVGRLFDDGSMDTSFGEQGWTIVGIGEDAVAQGLLIQENGRILIGGTYLENEVVSLFVIAFQDNGTVDETFGEKGIAIPPAEFAFSEGYGLAKDQGEELFIAAAVGVDEQRDAALFHFTPDGAPGLYFDGQPYIIAHAGAADDVLYDVQILASNTLVASGFTTEDGTKKFLLVRYGEQAGEPFAGYGNKSFSGKLGHKGPFQLSDLEIIENRSLHENRDIRIRALKMESSRDAFFHPPETMALPPDLEPLSGEQEGEEQRVLDYSLLARLFNLVGDFFVSPVAAAESSAKTMEATVIEVGPGDAVSYALGVVDEDNVVVVGTSSDETSDQMSVAKVTSATGSDGAISRYIVTTEIVDITRTGALTGGNILSGLSGVSQRGVVFSTDPYPIYEEAEGSDDDIGDETGGDDDGADGNDDDAGDQENLDDERTPVKVSVISPADGQNLSAGCDLLTLTTSTVAGCAYGLNSDPGYALMQAFPTTGTVHSLSMPVSSADTSVYVRCQARDSETLSSAAFTVSSDESGIPLGAVFRGLGSFLVTNALAADHREDETTESKGLFSAVNSTDDGFDEHGYTKDGSGIGQYSSRLSNLRPGTVYYVRAYALVGTAVLYGDQYSFQTADACFIATASYGSLLHPCVQVLRDFRDQCLLPTAWGQRLVDFYYFHAPALAAYIEQHQWARTYVQIVLLPLVAFSWLSLYCGISGAAFLIIAFIVGAVIIKSRGKRRLLQGRSLIC